MGNENMGATNAIFEIDKVPCLLGRNSNENTTGGSSLGLLLLGEAAVGGGWIIALEGDGAAKDTKVAHAGLPIKC